MNSAGQPAHLSIGALAFVPLAKGFIALISFLITALLGRWMGAEQFGHYSTALALVLLMGGLVGHTGDAALLKFVPAQSASNENRKSEYARAIFQLKMIGLVLLLAGAALLWPLSNVSNMGPSLPIGSAPLILLGATAMVLTGALSSYLQAARRYRAYIAIDFAQTCLRLILLLCLLATGLLNGYWALIAWVIASSVVFSVGVGWVGSAGFSLRPAPRAIYTETLKFTRLVGVGIALQMLYSRLDLIMVNAIASAQQAGIYSAALNLAGVPELGASFLLAVFYPNIVPWSMDGRYRRVLMQFLALATPLTVLFAGLCIVFAEPLILLIYGPEFAQSARVFQILVLGTALSFLVLPLAAPYVTLRLPRALIVVESVALGVIALGNIIAVPRYGAMGAAVVGAMARVVVAILIFTLVLRHTTSATPANQDAH